MSTEHDLARETARLAVMLARLTAALYYDPKALDFFKGCSDSTASAYADACELTGVGSTPAGRPATSDGEDGNRVHVGGCNERCVGGSHVFRCDQCGNLPGECVNDAGDVIGDCYRPASPVVAPSATDEDGA